jgi:hypothetical protein
VQVDGFEVALVGRRTIGDEDLVVLPPQHERGRLVFAEVGLFVWAGGRKPVARGGTCALEAAGIICYLCN